jgi:hypothetical protein
MVLQESLETAEILFSQGKSNEIFSNDTVIVQNIVTVSFIKIW